MTDFTAELPKYVLKHNHQILERAKKIFGEDLVAEAFIVAHKYSFTTPDEVNQYLDRAEKFRSSLDVYDNQLDLDSSEIFIKFTSGRILGFSSSEWGAISLINADDVILII